MANDAVKTDAPNGRDNHDASGSDQEDDEGAWDAQEFPSPSFTEQGWSCPACTLVNKSDALRCEACEGLRPDSKSMCNSSGVIVVLPPTRSSVLESSMTPRTRHPCGSSLTAELKEEPLAKRSRVEEPSTQTPNPKTSQRDRESWACPACTLINEPNATICTLCGGVRWITPAGPTEVAIPAQSLTAAALRVARNNSKGTAQSTPEIGVRRELGPDGHWSTLPPAPEGHLQHSTATDGDLDIFTDTCQAGVDSVTPGGVDDSQSENPPGSEVTRPSWGLAGAPLFAGVGSRLQELLGGADVAFEDAVERLSALGFDPTKCHLALEAANGDENLAKAFLMEHT